METKVIVFLTLMGPTLDSCHTRQEVTSVQECQELGEFALESYDMVTHYKCERFEQEMTKDET